MKQFPSGILSIVSDSFDLWKVCTEYLVTLKEEILNRDGKLVIRPDSGDPADILCGLNTSNHIDTGNYEKPEYYGVIELLWETFGGTTNEQGKLSKSLPPAIIIFNLQKLQIINVYIFHIFHH